MCPTTWFSYCLGLSRVPIGRREKRNMDIKDFPCSALNLEYFILYAKIRTVCDFGAVARQRFISCVPVERRECESHFFFPFSQLAHAMCIFYKLVLWFDDMLFSVKWVPSLSLVLKYNFMWTFTHVHRHTHTCTLAQLMTVDEHVQVTEMLFAECAQMLGAWLLYKTLSVTIQSNLTSTVTCQSEHVSYAHWGALKGAYLTVWSPGVPFALKKMDVGCFKLWSACERMCK